MQIDLIVVMGGFPWFDWAAHNTLDIVLLPADVIYYIVGVTPAHGSVSPVPYQRS